MKTDFTNRGIEVAPNHCDFLLLLLLGKCLEMVKLTANFLTLLTPFGIVIDCLNRNSWIRHL